MATVRSLAKLLLVLNLAVSTQGLLVVQGMFALRRDYVVQNLCVNRDKPVADCHGRCFLKKELEERQREQERRADGLEVMLAVSALPPPAGAALRAPEHPAPPRPLAPPVALMAGAPADVFHPPRVG